jgi:hypothetical protein
MSVASEGKSEIQQDRRRRLLARSAACINKKGQAAMPLDADYFSGFHGPDPSLTALLLLADPVSTLLEEHQLHVIGDVALHKERPIARREIATLLACAYDIRQLRRGLKRAITGAYADGDIDAGSTQRLVDRFELWSD